MLSWRSLRGKFSGVTPSLSHSRSCRSHARGPRSARHVNRSDHISSFSGSRWVYPTLSGAVKSYRKNGILSSRTCLEKGNLLERDLIRKGRVPLNRVWGHLEGAFQAEEASAASVCLVPVPLVQKLLASGTSSRRIAAFIRIVLCIFVCSCHTLFVFRGDTTPCKQP